MRDMVGGDTPNIRAICAATADLIAEMLKHSSAWWHGMACSLPPFSRKRTCQPAPLRLEILDLHAHATRAARRGCSPVPFAGRCRQLAHGRNT